MTPRALRQIITDVNYYKKLDLLTGRGVPVLTIPEWFCMFTYQGSWRNCSIVQRTANSTTTLCEGVIMSLTYYNHNYKRLTPHNYHTNIASWSQTSQITQCLSNVVLRQTSCARTHAHTHTYVPSLRVS
jgi:hypothetical protein